MAKQTGLGDALWIDGYDLSNDIQQVGRIGGGPSALDMTGIDKSGYERVGGLRDGSIEMVTYLNDAAGRAHPRLSTLPTADVVVSYGRGTVLGSAGASCVAKQIGYDGTRSDDGMLTFKVQAQSNGYGVEWGRQLTAGKRADTTATNGSSVDLGTSSPGAFGLQMYVHLFAFTGTSVTIKIQESSDDGAGDAFADVVGATSGALTAIGSARVATAAINVERYLRVVTTGTFSVATFAVIATRNDTSVVF